MTVKITVVGDAQLKGKLKELARKSVPLLKKALLKSAIQVEGEAKERCHAVTGRLRSSLVYEIIENSDNVEARVGPNNEVDYGIYVEFGTTKQKAHPFLRPGLDNSKVKILQFISDVGQELR